MCVDRFEKIDPFPILALRRNFLKSVKRPTAAEHAFYNQRRPNSFLEGRTPDMVYFSSRQQITFTHNVNETALIQREKKLRCIFYLLTATYRAATASGSLKLPRQGFT
jgi:hypothetical protein